MKMAISINEYYASFILNVFSFTVMVSPNKLYQNALDKVIKLYLLWRWGT